MLESITELLSDRAAASSLLDDVPAGLARFDREGRLIACNPEMRRLLGEVPERAEEIVLRPLAPLAAGAPGQAGDEPIAEGTSSPLLRALSSEGQGSPPTRAEELELVPAVGPPRWVRASIVAASDGPGGAWLLLVDVGERRSLDSLREQVLGVVAHDLRNPMSAMRMTLAMLAKKVELPLERRVTLAERLAGTLGRMEGLVNTLVEYARAELGVEVRLARGPADLGAIYDRVRQDLDVIHPGRLIEVDRRGDLVGSWDAARLERIVAHLLGNALKHGADDSPVKLLLDGSAPGEVVLSVHNQGPPIPPELLPVVFEPFSTGAIDKTGRRRAIGLGLFIVRHLVTAHGGSLDLRSGAEGTTVTVTLPRSAGEGSDGGV